MDFPKTGTQIDVLKRKKRLPIFGKPFLSLFLQARHEIREAFERIDVAVAYRVV